MRQKIKAGAVCFATIVLSQAIATASAENVDCSSASEAARKIYNGLANAASKGDFKASILLRLNFWNLERDSSSCSDVEALAKSLKNSGYGPVTSGDLTIYSRMPTLGSALGAGMITPHLASSLGAFAGSYNLSGPNLERTREETNFPVLSPLKPIDTTGFIPQNDGGPGPKDILMPQHEVQTTNSLRK